MKLVLILTCILLHMVDCQQIDNTDLGLSSRHGRNVIAEKNPKIDKDMTISILDIKRKRTFFKVKMSSSTLLDLKKLIKKKEGIPIAKQELYGERYRKLKDDDLYLHRDYNIKNLDTLFLNIKP